IISCGGGELMCGILPYLDFEKIRRSEPKWFIGYSDNTNLIFPLATICDTASIYGPCAPAFGMEPRHEAVQFAEDLLKGKSLSFKGFDTFELESAKTEENPLAPYNLTEKSVKRGFVGNNEVSEMRFKGRLLGGCLDCLQILCGTRFDKVADFNNKYEEDGVLWFLEACDLNPMGVRRALWQLEQAGWFEKAAGFLIGRPMHYGEELMGLTQLEAVLGVLGKYKLPILIDADIGHLPPAIPLVSGAVAEVRFQEGNWEVSMALQ
ncbi:MAG: LD-carboxypeptidase, partial [Lachnospiraceae bacterium]|nr:LD-carboxypeptidase [Lachnospiraceae bacterium]